MNFSGKVAMITGAAAGIGLATAKILSDSGASVVIAQKDVGRTAPAAKQFQNATLLALEIDICDPVSVNECVTKTIKALGRIDILVNNASITGKHALSSFLSSTPESVDRIVDTNFKGTIYCSQIVANHMVEQRDGGSIIQVSSIGAFCAQENASIYCATKAAQTALTRSMALELAPFNIRVNCVAPGDIATETSAQATKDVVNSGASGRYLRLTPLGRRGTPEEVAQAIAFLASEEASFVTGATLLVDGGILTY